jgi:hypothetical protein
MSEPAEKPSLKVLGTERGNARRQQKRAAALAIGGTLLGRTLLFCLKQPATSYKHGNAVISTVDVHLRIVIKKSIK